MKKIIKNVLRPFYRIYKKYMNERTFKKGLRDNRNQALKIVIGSSGIYEEEWIPSEASFLNLLNEEDWFKYFNENQIDCLLAEHVWEHLTEEEGKLAAQICFKFLKKGGWLRVAVPDGFHNSQDYVDYVKPGGYGAGADDHKVLYNYKTFATLFSSAGFKVNFLEYFDENGNFNAVDWKKDDGFIHRSARYDERNANGQLNYTSLILDAIKS